MRRYAVWLVMALAGMGVVAARGTGQEPTREAGAAQEDVVRGVLFYSPSCPHCREVMQDRLPPILERYGERVLIAAVNTGTEGGQALYGAVVLHFRLPRERLGVPTLVVGSTVLVGSYEIPTRLPELADAALGHGGIDWPDVPRLREALAADGLLDAPERSVAARDDAEADAEAPAPAPDPSVSSRAARPASAPEPALPGPSATDPARGLEEAQPAARPADPLPAPTVDAPTVDAPTVDAPVADAVNDAGAAGPQAGGAGGGLLRLETGEASSSTVMSRFLRDPVGNGAAVVVLALMGAVLAAVVARVMGRMAWPRSPEWLVPIAAVAGVGVAGYLALVEVTGAEAVCGPVGDCNTVQQSPYARLFGVIPIGVLGVLGYIAMLGAWVAAKVVGRLQRAARFLLWGMAVMGMVLSIYLTFLEPFVIGATCAWCLTSALLTTAILVAATGTLPAASTSAPAGLGRAGSAPAAPVAVDPLPGDLGDSPTADRHIPTGVGRPGTHR